MIVSITLKQRFDDGRYLDIYNFEQQPLVGDILIFDNARYVIAERRWLVGGTMLDVLIEAEQKGLVRC